MFKHDTYTRYFFIFRWSIAILIIFFLFVSKIYPHTFEVEVDHISVIRELEHLKEKWDNELTKKEREIIEKYSEDNEKYSPDNR